MMQASSAPQSRAKWMWTVGKDVVVRGVLGQIPRSVYGNDAGMMNNYRANRELAKLRAQGARPSQAAPPAQVDALRRQGFIELGNPHDKSLLDVIYSKYQTALRDPAISRAIGQEVKEGARQIREPIKHIPEIAQLLTPEIQGIYESYFGAPMKVEHVRAWRNAPLPVSHQQRDVYSNLWHNDEFSINTFRLFVYMTDGVTRETGAFRCHPRESTRKILRSGYLRRGIILGPAKKMIEDPSRIVYVEGGIGTTFIANPQLCLHRAGVPKAGSFRDIVQFTIGPSATPLPADWAQRLPVDDGGVG